MKIENLTQCVCDICGKSVLIGKNQSDPMCTLRLPMKYFSETGRPQGLTNQEVDVCSDCWAELERNLSVHYDMICIPYDGFRIERRHK